MNLIRNSKERILRQLQFQAKYVQLRDASGTSLHEISTGKNIASDLHSSKFQEGIIIVDFDRLCVLCTEEPSDGELQDRSFQFRCSTYFLGPEQSPKFLLEKVTQGDLDDLSVPVLGWYSFCALVFEHFTDVFKTDGIYCFSHTHTSDIFVIQNGDINLHQQTRNDKLDLCLRRIQFSVEHFQEKSPPILNFSENFKLDHIQPRTFASTNDLALTFVSNMSHNMDADPIQSQEIRKRSHYLSRFYSLLFILTKVSFCMLLVVLPLWGIVELKFKIKNGMAAPITPPTELQIRTINAISWLDSMGMQYPEYFNGSLDIASNLEQIFQATPADLWFERVRYSESEGYLISGSARTVSEYSDFVKRLQASGKYFDLQPISTEINPMVDAKKPAVQFSISLRSHSP